MRLSVLVLVFWLSSVYSAAQRDFSDFFTSMDFIKDISAAEFKTDKSEIEFGESADEGVFVKPSASFRTFRSVNEEDNEINNDDDPIALKLQAKESIDFQDGSDILDNFKNDYTDLDVSASDNVEVNQTKMANFTNLVNKTELTSHFFPETEGSKGFSKRNFNVRAVKEYTSYLHEDGEEPVHLVFKHNKVDTADLSDCARQGDWQPMVGHPHHHSNSGTSDHEGYLEAGSQKVLHHSSKDRPLIRHEFLGGPNINKLLQGNHKEEYIEVEEPKQKKHRPANDHQQENHHTYHQEKQNMDFLKPPPMPKISKPSPSQLPQPQKLEHRYRPKELDSPPIYGKPQIYRKHPGQKVAEQQHISVGHHPPKHLHHATAPQQYKPVHKPSAQPHQQHGAHQQQHGPHQQQHGPQHGPHQQQHGPHQQQHGPHQQQHGPPAHYQAAAAHHHAKHPEQKGSFTCGDSHDHDKGTNYHTASFQVADETEPGKVLVKEQNIEYVEDKPSPSLGFYSEPAEPQQLFSAFPVNNLGQQEQASSGNLFKDQFSSWQQGNNFHNQFNLGGQNQPAPVLHVAQGFNNINPPPQQAGQVVTGPSGEATNLFNFPNLHKNAGDTSFFTLPSTAQEIQHERQKFQQLVAPSFPLANFAYTIQHEDGAVHDVQKNAPLTFPPSPFQGQEDQFYNRPQQQLNHQQEQLHHQQPGNNYIENESEEDDDERGRDRVGQQSDEDTDEFDEQEDEEHNEEEDEEIEENDHEESHDEDEDAENEDTKKNKVYSNYNSKPQIEIHQEGNHRVEEPNQFSYNNFSPKPSNHEQNPQTQALDEEPYYHFLRPYHNEEDDQLSPPPKPPKQFKFRPGKPYEKYEVKEDGADKLPPLNTIFPPHKNPKQFLNRPPNLGGPKKKVPKKPPTKKPKNPSHSGSLDVVQVLTPPPHFHHKKRNQISRKSDKRPGPIKVSTPVTIDMQNKQVIARVVEVSGG